jgi:putative RecB family exonuclease
MIGLIESEPVVEKSTAISATRLNTWLSCRLKYYFRYVLHLKSPKTAALYVGSTVHSVLKQWNRARWRKTTLSLEQLEQVYELAWVTDQATEKVAWEVDEEAGEKTLGWKLLHTYVNKTPIDPQERPEGVEVKVEADLSHHGLPKIMGIGPATRH